MGREKEETEQKGNEQCQFRPTEEEYEGRTHMLAKTRVANDDPDGRLGVIPDEDLRPSLEERHSRVLLDPRLVNQVVVEDDLAVRRRKVVALLAGFVRVLTGRAFAVLACRTLEILAFEGVDLVDDAREDTGRVLGVGRGALDCDGGKSSQ